MAPSRCRWFKQAICRLLVLLFLAHYSAGFIAIAKGRTSVVQQLSMVEPLLSSHFPRGPLNPIHDGNFVPSEASSIEQQTTDQQEPQATGKGGVSRSDALVQVNVGGQTLFLPTSLAQGLIASGAAKPLHRGATKGARRLITNLFRKGD
ncbi:unnamed protein product [Heterosigma akashiwo]